MVHTEAVQRAAVAQCALDATQEDSEFGVVAPSAAMQPLWPPLSCNEYEAMERDTAKYLLYSAALRVAVAEAAGKTDFITVLVVGGGRGRLAHYAMDAIQECGAAGKVHVLDASARSVDYLKARFSSEVKSGGLSVHGPYMVSPCNQEPPPPSLEPLRARCDVIVSEVFGSFGDNEFLPEIMSTASELWGRPGQCVLVPQSWSTYLAPVSSPSIAKLNLARVPHVMGMPDDCTLLAPLVEAYSAQVTSKEQVLKAQLEFDCKQIPGPAKRRRKGDSHQDCPAPDGLIGFFTSELVPVTDLPTQLCDCMGVADVACFVAGVDY